MIVETLNLGLTMSGVCTIMLGAIFGHRLQRADEPNANRVYYAVVAIAQGQMMIGGIITHSPIAYLSAAACAICVYLWWNNGGGGGIRRALSKIKSRLTIVRLVWGSV
jgi:hypothetical protein